MPKEGYLLSISLLNCLVTVSSDYPMGIEEEEDRWIQVDGRLKYLTVPQEVIEEGSIECWGVNADDEIYFRRQGKHSWI